MHNPDGPEERTAELAEREYDDTIAEDCADTARMQPTREEELEAVLRDIAFGAEMMLQGPIPPTGWVKGYIEEVRRVAHAGLLI